MTAATRRLISDAVRKHISRDHERRRADAEAARICREMTTVCPRICA